jgi:hypothetical protein
MVLWRMLRPWALGALLAAQSACGNGSSDGTPPPPSPPMVCDLASVRGRSPLRYRLVTSDEPPYDEGSTLTIRDPHVQREDPPPSPLSGTFDVVAVDPLPEGARFAVTVVATELHADPYRLQPSNPNSPRLAPPGAITASVDGGVAASIDLGVEFDFAAHDAQAATIGGDCPPRIDGLALGGSGTTGMRSGKARLSAIPES